MAQNTGLFGRRELWAHRRFVTGLTASAPAYKEVDSIGNKDWVVDVYIGPLDAVGGNLVKDCLISPYARNLLGDVRQPVELERSKQGRYTVIGRTKTMPAGAQMPEGSILEPTYHRIEFNLSELKLRHIADLDYQLEGWGDKDWGETDKPWQTVNASDAFGNQILGEGVSEDDVPPDLALEPASFPLTRHLVIDRKTWGPGGDPDAIAWGEDEWGAMGNKIVESET